MAKYNTDDIAEAVQREAEEMGIAEGLPEKALCANPKCRKEFQIKPGPGRKPMLCPKCREAGVSLKRTEKVNVCETCLSPDCKDRGEKTKCSRYTPNPKPSRSAKPDLDYRPPQKANPLLDSYDRFMAECRRVFIERQNQHGKTSIMDVTLEDLVGVHRLKGARIKQQVKNGIPDPDIYKDSLIDSAVYCYILWAAYSGEWQRLEWEEV